MDTSNKSAAEADLALYRRMSFIRTFEKKCLELSTGDDPAAVGSIHLCAGQEAIPVGALAALGPSDQVVATYRGHGWAIEAGVDPYQVMAEICHRKDGVNGGRAGSALMMAPEQRFIGENSIVGAGAPIADGVALALQAMKRDSAAVVTFGDGALSQGSLHEAMVFAAMKKLPVIFICENNHWSELTPISRVIPFDRLSRRATGYGITGVTVDGCDPTAVRDAVSSARHRAIHGEGPTLIECNTVRLWGHYNRDIEHYRPREDRKAAETRDPLLLARERIAFAHGTPVKVFQEIDSELDAEIHAMAVRVIAAAHPDKATALDHVVGTSAISVDERWDGAPLDELTYQRAVNLAIKAELDARDEVLVFGEDVGHAGGIFGCTRDLQKGYGEHRVFDTPIAEAAILGAAVGAATMGMRPIAEIMWMDFLLVALDQLVNQAANTRYITRGQTSLPMVVRVQQGATPGSCAQHSQSLEAILAHIPGLKVGLPSSPQDAYDMLRAAVADPDPCIIIEARSLYQTKGAIDGSRTPVGRARLRRKGAEIAIVSWGTMVNVAAAAAEELSKEGIDAAVLDLRWLNPLDLQTLHQTVRTCGGRALVVHEANRTGGFGAEIVAQLYEAGFRQVRRLATPDTRIPAAPVLQSAVLPDAGAIKDAVRRMVLPEFIS